MRDVSAVQKNTQQSEMVRPRVSSHLCIDRPLTAAIARDVAMRAKISQSCSTRQVPSRSKWKVYSSCHKSKLVGHPSRWCSIAAVRLPPLLLPASGDHTRDPACQPAVSTIKILSGASVWPTGLGWPAKTSHFHSFFHSPSKDVHRGNSLFDTSTLSDSEILTIQTKPQSWLTQTTYVSLPRQTAMPPPRRACPRTGLREK